MVDTFNRTNNILSSLIQKDEVSQQVFVKTLKHQITQQETWSRKVCVCEYDKYTTIKRLQTLMWLVHNILEQKSLIQWP